MSEPISISSPGDDEGRRTRCTVLLTEAASLSDGGRAVYDAAATCVLVGEESVLGASDRPEGVVSWSVKLLLILEGVAVLDFRRCPCEGGARWTKEEDRPSCSSGLLLRNSDELAERIEPDECAERVGDGGGCKEDASEAYEAEVMGVSEKCREFLRIAVG